MKQILKYTIGDWLEMTPEADSFLLVSVRNTIFLFDILWFGNYRHQSSSWATFLFVDNEKTFCFTEFLIVRIAFKKKTIKSRILRPSINPIAPPISAKSWFCVYYKICMFIPCWTVQLELFNLNTTEHFISRVTLFLYWNDQYLKQNHPMLKKLHSKNKMVSRVQP